MKVIEAKAPEICCCYCKRRFTPPVRVAVDERTDENLAKNIARSMVQWIEEGVPLECGECRK